MLTAVARTGTKTVSNIAQVFAITRHSLAVSPKKSGVKKVTIAHVSKVISEVYGSRIVNSCGGEQPTIPLQQKLLICTILLMQKESKLREIPVGQVRSLNIQANQSLTW